jgi:hypothetical protein
MKNIFQIFKNQYFAQKSILLAGAFGLVLLSTSCEQVIDIDLPDYAEENVLNGMLIAGDSSFGNSFWYDHSAESGFRLSRSQPIQNRNPINLDKNGRIIIEENGQGFEVISQTDNEGMYRPTNTFTPGNTYDVRSEMSGGLEGPWKEEIFVPVKTDFTNVQVRETNRFYDIDLSFNDPEGENAYLIEIFQLYIDPDFPSHAMPTSMFFNVLHPDFSSLSESDPFEPDNYYLSGILRDHSFDGQNTTITIRIDKNNYSPLNGYKIYLSWLSMSIDMSRFFTTFYLNPYGGNPGGFLTEPVPFFFNVENGIGTVVTGTRSNVEIQ